MPSDRRVRGKLNTGGWISLIDTAKSRLCALPFPLGVYQYPSPTGSDFGACVEVVETKLYEEDHAVRGRLISGAWTMLVNCATGHEDAKPIQRGVYTIAVDSLPSNASARSTIVKDGAVRKASVVASFRKESPVEVVETRYLYQEEQVRLKLSSGQWISLFSSSDRNKWTAEPLRLGCYETTVDRLTISKNSMLGSKPVKCLMLGSQFDVVETRLFTDEQRIIGRLQGGGWITLINSNNMERHSKKIDRII